MSGSVFLSEEAINTVTNILLCILKVWYNSVYVWFVVLYSNFSDNFLSTIECCSILNSFMLLSDRHVVQPVLPETLSKNKVHSLRVISQRKQSQCKRRTLRKNLWQCHCFWRWYKTCRMKMCSLLAFLLATFGYFVVCYCQCPEALHSESTLITFSSSIKRFIGTCVSMIHGLILMPNYTIQNGSLGFNQRKLNQ